MRSNHALEPTANRREILARPAGKVIRRLTSIVVNAHEQNDENFYFTGVTAVLSEKGQITIPKPDRESSVCSPVLCWNFKR